MKQTAVEWLIETLTEEGFDLSLHTFETKQAKAMEKEQIIQARTTSPLLASIDKDDYIKEAEQYYNETYEKR